MKKILLTATILLGMTALVNAQQGRVGVNTATPAATMDIIANATDAAQPDALLVPRLTRAQLNAKAASYTVVQDGGLVFVTTLDGTATGQTAAVIARGFYYFDGPTLTWVAL